MPPARPAICVGSVWRGFVLIVATFFSSVGCPPATGDAAPVHGLLVATGEALADPSAGSDYRFTFDAAFFFSSEERDEARVWPPALEAGECIRGASPALAGIATMEGAAYVAAEVRVVSGNIPEIFHSLSLADDHLYSGDTVDSSLLPILTPWDISLMKASGRTERTWVSALFVPNERRFELAEVDGQAVVTWRRDFSVASLYLRVGDLFCAIEENGEFVLPEMPAAGTDVHLTALHINRVDDPELGTIVAVGVADWVQQVPEP